MTTSKKLGKLDYLIWDGSRTILEKIEVLTGKDVEQVADHMAYVGEQLFHTGEAVGTMGDKVVVFTGDQVASMGL